MHIHTEANVCVCLCVGYMKILELRQSEDLGTPVPEQELVGHSKTVNFLVADDENNRLFSGGHDNFICIWVKNEKMDDFMQTQIIPSLNKSHWFTCMTMMSNVNSIAAGMSNGYIGIWCESTLKESTSTCDTSDNDRKEPLSVTQSMIDSKQWWINTLHQRPIDQDLSSNSTYNTVWTCVHSWKAHNGAVTSIQYVENNNALVTCGEDGYVHLFYVCHPGFFPSLQVMPKNTITETSNESFLDINSARLMAEDYSPAVRNKLFRVFEHIQQAIDVDFTDHLEETK
ncbi:hypothetical protein RFI_29762 [Reticulomyxa filosa]|uniref:Uncharacterized protein n=1 Tax=Reticulomyxa filosa TaxID=46433 RepID=X6M0B5_RETFI|nr:hypothetical protein RFI_29762 [Reticulomyxa filosa]|eukprot:ETO07628.1 hypothetical protein RFI_29762 [Reticulomyxa filosa]